MLKTVKIWFIICVKTKGAIMKEFEAEQAHEFRKICGICVEVPAHVTPTSIRKDLQSLFDKATHVVPGGGAIL